MSAPMRPLLVEYGDADVVTRAAERLQHGGGVRVTDALTPFPVPALAARVAARPGPLRPIMALAGFGVALLFVALQVWSQAYAYPLNSGGRPLVSWQIYYLVPFETGVLAAAIAGYLVMFWRTGLPRYHHPIFALPGIERATQDRFFLVLEGPANELDARRLEKTLFDTGAISVREVGA
jgi:hypothetical protein